MRMVISRIQKYKFIIIIAMISFLTVMAINHFIFPYYSNNHDEGVYIFQAKMLAEGKIYLNSDEYSDFFNTWFFINDDNKLYSRYTPVHSLIICVFILLGNMGLTIGVMAGLNIIFLYFIAKEIYDKDTAKIVSIICLSSPLFLIISSTYLSYTSSFLFGMIFIYYFIKSTKNDNRKYPMVAGIFLGVLFFDRPYDAILIGIPFIGYIIYRTVVGRDKKNFTNLYLICLSFLPIFLIVLSYNYVLTGNPFLFPFSKYEPLDTLGFGIKTVSPYSPIYLYTIDEAIESTKIFLYQLLFNWTAVGIFFICFSLFAILFRKRLRLSIYRLSIYEKLLLMMFLSGVMGNFLFWGIYHTLKWENAINMFGPIYYFNLLLPISVIFGRVTYHINNYINNQCSAVRLYNIKLDRFIGSIILVLIVLANIWLVYPKMELNYKYTEKNEKMYSIILDNKISNAVIFLPTIYGPYIQHPFGYLINDPSFNGSIVYSKDLGGKNVQLMNKYKGRDYYLYQYYGMYTESYNDNAIGRLIKLNFAEDNDTKVNKDEKFVTYIWSRGNTNFFILDSASEKDKPYNMILHTSSDDVVYVQDSFKLSNDDSSSLLFLNDTIWEKES